MQEYTIEKTSNFGGLEISRSGLRYSGLIACNDGLCRANSQNPKENRTIEWYDKNVLNTMIENGKINDGSKGGFDDRKLRYDKAEYVNSKSGSTPRLNVHFGHSNFLEYREKLGRTKKETEGLTNMGIEHFNDPYAFFPRNPGVTAIIKTNDKKIIIGQRNVQPDKFEGLLQGAAGHLNFEKNCNNISIINNMYREVEEETGVANNSIKYSQFLGLFSDPSVGGDDLDFCYLVDVELPSNYFTQESWKDKVEKPEHSKFFAIKDYDSLEKLVNIGKLEEEKLDIIFSTRGALEQLNYNDFK